MSGNVYLHLKGSREYFVTPLHKRKMFTNLSKPIINVKKGITWVSFVKYPKIGVYISNFPVITLSFTVIQQTTYTTLKLFLIKKSLPIKHFELQNMKNGFHTISWLLLCFTKRKSFWPLWRDWWIMSFTFHLF